jgi:saccharopine dehydrogenase-like NADP-dependent oxidoreductase
MNSILIIGAGRSSGALIQYLLEKGKANNWYVTVADTSLDAAKAAVMNHPNGKATWLDVNKPNDRKDTIAKADIVISLLPAHMHVLVAKDCLTLRKHLMTASYVSKEIYELDEYYKNAGIVFMGELGLDPGIDHMSAMKAIHEIHEKGGKLESFKSYCGGLVAPESDDNPWHYKFSWSPRNVILAGQGTALFKQNGQHKYIPYGRLFKLAENIEIPELGTYEAYANRDSLLYEKIYGLEETPTILRATLRHVGFCKAWHAFVKLGVTDDTYPYSTTPKMNYRQWIEGYLLDSENDKNKSTKERLAQFLKEEIDSDLMQKMEWLGLFTNTHINLENATSAQILQKLLANKLVLKPEDKDMVLMQHEFVYTMDGKTYKRTSTMKMIGENAKDTAMAKLVGLPLGMFVHHLMTKGFSERGVHIPVSAEVYLPILAELEEHGVRFVEKEVEL